MAEHSPFGGSQAGRYLKCPGSIRLAEKAPPKGTSSYAEEGTFAHSLAERCLTADLDPLQLVGSTIRHPSVASEKIVTQEMAEAVAVYVDEVWRALGTPADVSRNEIEVEQRFRLSVPSADDGEVFGTNDALVYTTGDKKMTIFDYKHGQGVMVAAEDNSQLMFYALGALQGHPEWEVEEVELVIVQPRATFGDKIKRWSMPLWQIIEFPELLDEAIRLAKSDDPPFAAGDWCQFCPAKLICTVREQAFVKEAGPAFKRITDITMAELPTLPDADAMARWVQKYEELGQVAATYREHIDAILLAGGEVEGWKVVEKQARRGWTSSGEDVAAYLNLAYDIDPGLVIPRTLVNLTEAKRVLKSAVEKGAYADAERDLEDRFTKKESSGLTTAPVSDRRAAVAVAASPSFGAVMLGTDGDDE